MKKVIAIDDSTYEKLSELKGQMIKEKFSKEKKFDVSYDDVIKRLLK